MYIENFIKMCYTQAPQDTCTSKVTKSLRSEDKLKMHLAFLREMQIYPIQDGVVINPVVATSATPAFTAGPTRLKFHSTKITKHDTSKSQQTFQHKLKTTKSQISKKTI